MAGDHKRWHEVLHCASQLGAAVWIRAPDGSLCHVNNRAEVLLGRPAASFLGKPCHRALSARDAAGNAFCAPACPIFRRVRRHAEILPVDLRIALTDGSVRWLRVQVIPFAATGRGIPYLVHCAFCIDAEKRMRDFVQHLAARSHPAMLSERGGGAVRDPSLDIVTPSTFGLTPRERQVLDLLAQDRTLIEISGALGVTYTTVRNHIQHILPKLGVHSILEAVAVHVLTSSDPSER